VAMSLTPPPKVQKLQETLHVKAKGSPGYRFYQLYDKVYRRDVLEYAYRCCSANGGAPGVDGQTFADIEKYGVGLWLDELTEDLKKKTYRPQAVRRVNIPKPGQSGRTRPLGIPTVKDRVVLGHEKRLGAKIVNYADDFVICCRGTANQAMTTMRAMMQKLKLTVNEAKTHVCRLPEESFDFLGYTIGRCYSTQTGRAYLGTRPSRKKVLGLCREISEMTGRQWTLLDAAERVSRLNRMLVGWANYFSLGPVSKAYRIVDGHVRHRLRQWLCAKHKVQGQGTSQYPDEYLEQTLGLVRLQSRTRNFPWATT
jgi:hypothetical protein